MNVELMNKVREAILDNPRRVDMGDFCYSKEKCGTVGCIAGWAMILSGIKPSFIKAGDFSPHNVGRDLLNISDEQAHKLFYVNSWPWQDIRIELYKSNEGTKRYARAVAAACDCAIQGWA